MKIAPPVLEDPTLEEQPQVETQPEQPVKPEKPVAAETWRLKRDKIDVRYHGLDHFHASLELTGHNLTTQGIPGIEEPIKEACLQTPEAKEYLRILGIYQDHQAKLAELDKEIEQQKQLEQATTLAGESAEDIRNDMTLMKRDREALQESIDSLRGPLVTAHETAERVSRELLTKLGHEKRLELRAEKAKLQEQVIELIKPLLIRYGVLNHQESTASALHYRASSPLPALPKG